MEILHSLLDIILPARCLGCGNSGEIICALCMKQIPLQDHRTHINELTVFSSIAYSPKASRILLAAKEDGIRAADQFLKIALLVSLNRAMVTLGARPILVPIPHSRRAVRKRGRNFVTGMTAHVASLNDLPVKEILHHTRLVKDQAGLNIGARHGNLSGAMSVVKQCGRGREVVLVDDLVTTGATLGEADRALREAGFQVIAAITALVALPLR